MIHITITSDARAEGKTTTALKLFSQLPDSILVLRNKYHLSTMKRLIAQLGISKERENDIYLYPEYMKDGLRRRPVVPKYIIWDVN